MKLMSHEAEPHDMRYEAEPRNEPNFFSVHSLRTMSERDRTLTSPSARKFFYVLKHIPERSVPVAADDAMPP